MSRPVNLPTEKQGESADRLQVEQRRHRRIPTNLSVQVTWIDAFGFENVAPAVVRDISAGGFGIEAYQGRPVGSRLTVTTQADSMRCVVRHLRAARGGFYLGLEILPSVDEIANTKDSLERLQTALSRDTADE